MATDINTYFTRKLLSLMHDDVRMAFPQIKNLMQACSVTNSMRHDWFAEIVVPGQPRFNVDVRAHDAYEARYKAWSKFLAKYGPADFHADVADRATAQAAAT